MGSSEPTASLQTTSVSHDFGRVMVGSVLSTTVALSSSGSDAATTNASVVPAGDAGTSTFSPASISALTASGVNATLFTSTTGARTGTVTIDNLATDSAGPSQGSDNGNAVVNLSATVVDNRTLAATAVNLGLLHVDQTSAAQDTTISSVTGEDAKWTRISVPADAANASVTDGTIALTAGTAYQFGGTNDAVNSTQRGITGTFTAGGSKSGNATFTPAGEGCRAVSAWTNVNTRGRNRCASWLIGFDEKPLRSKPCEAIAGVRSACPPADQASLANRRKQTQTRTLHHPHWGKSRLRPLRGPRMRSRG